MRGRLQKRLDELDLQQRYKTPEKRADVTRMDSNENYLVPASLQREALRLLRGRDIREYPAGGVERLSSAIAGHLGVPDSCVGVGNGSGQILDLILSFFAAGGSRVLAPDPTFAFFLHRCRLYSIPVIGVPFSDDMKLDAGAFAEAAGDADILYIDSPNNPTGFQFSESDILGVIDGFDGLVVVDEAYGDFGGYSLARRAADLDNLIVVRTFSKSHGLAGLRLGYFAASERFARAFSVIQHPYPVNSLAVEAAVLALSRSEQMRDVARMVKEERRRVTDVLRGYGAFEVFDSNGNFVLFDAGAAYRRVHRALEEQGVSVRVIGRVGEHEGCLRVTVGTKRMNSKFLLAVRDLLR